MTRYVQLLPTVQGKSGPRVIAGAPPPLVAPVAPPAALTPPVELPLFSPGSSPPHATANVAINIGTAKPRTTIMIGKSPLVFKRRAPHPDVSGGGSRGTSQPRVLAATRCRGIFRAGVRRALSPARCRRADRGFSPRSRARRRRTDRAAP